MTNVGGYDFKVTIVYGERTPSNRQELWENIKRIKFVTDQYEWFFVGDFNEIRNPNERDGIVFLMLLELMNLTMRLVD